jgi:hypothetical protein
VVEQRKCDSCGAPLPVWAVAGQCEACLLAGWLQTQQDCVEKPLGNRADMAENPGDRIHRYELLQ